MRVHEAEARFRSMLVEAGVNPDDLDLRRTWEVFKVFAALPIEDVDPTMDGDRLLFETRLAPRTRRDSAAGSAYPVEPEAYEVLLDRQFYLTEPDGEYAGMNALSVTLQFEPTPELAELPLEQVTGCGGPPWPDRDFGAALDWAREVEQRQGFNVPRELYEPVDGFFVQGPI